MKALQKCLNLVIAIVSLAGFAPPLSAGELTTEDRSAITEALQSCSSSADSYQAVDCFSRKPLGHAGYVWGCGRSHYADNAFNCYKQGLQAALAGVDPYKTIESSCMIASPLAYEKAACFDTALGRLPGSSPTGAIYSGCGAGEPPLARISCYRTGLQMLRDQAPLIHVIDKLCAAFNESASDQSNCLHEALGRTSGPSGVLYFGCPSYTDMATRLGCYQEGIARIMRGELYERIVLATCTTKGTRAQERASCFQEALMTQYLSVDGVTRMVDNCRSLESAEKIAQCYTEEMKDYIGM